MNNNENKKKSRDGSHRKKIIIICASALTLLVTVGIVLALLLKEEFDYFTSDLSRYVTIEESAYKGYEISVKSVEADYSSVERKIQKLLCINRDTKPEFSGGEVKHVPISVGDKVRIYYRAYVLDETGKEVILSSNNAVSSALAYSVGSFEMSLRGQDHSLDGITSYLEGFDEGLLNVLPSDHFLAKEEIITSGRVAADDYIVFSVSDGTSRVYYSATLEECDSVFGTGLKNYLTDAKIGGSPDECETVLNGNKVVYNNIKVEYALRTQSAPLKIEVEFPYNYIDPTLRGEVAYFEVWFRGSVVYNTPEYNSEFITETLGFTEQMLSEYEGANIEEKHRAMLLETCKQEIERSRSALIDEAVWNRLVGSATVKKLPVNEVESMYNDIYSELYLMYSSYYSKIYSTPEEFCAWYYGLSSTEEVQARVTEEAERAITEKLIFYYIARKENLLPTGDGFAKAYNDLVEEYLFDYIQDYYADEVEKLSGDVKEKRISEIRSNMLEAVGEGYFAELTYYEHAYPKIVEFAVIK